MTGRQIRKAREARGWGLEKLAAEVGVRLRTVERWENGKHKPTPMAKQKLAEVMTLAGTAVTALLTQAGVESSPAYVQSLVSAVVGILNVQAMPTTASA